MSRMIKLQHPTIKSEPHTVGKRQFDVDANGVITVPEDEARVLEAGRWCRIGVVEMDSTSAGPRQPGPGVAIPRSLHEFRQMIQSWGMRARDLLSVASDMERDENAAPAEAQPDNVADELPSVEMAEDGDIGDPFGIGVEQSEPTLGVPRLIAAGAEEDIRLPDQPPKPEKKQDEPKPPAQGSLEAMLKGQEQEKDKGQEVDISAETPLSELRRVADLLGVSYSRRDSSGKLFKLICQRQKKEPK